MSKKIIKKESKESSVGFTFQKLGNGILMFFEILFKFILDFMKLLPALLKVVVWLVLVSMLAAFVGMFFVYVTFSALGIKDSPNFQAYRETVIEKFLDEHGYDFIPSVDAPAEADI